MGIIILQLVIFSLIFTTINCDTIPCLENPSCQCLLPTDDSVHMYCVIDNNTKYVISIGPKDYVKVICQNWKGWENFNYTSKLPKDQINLFEFKRCGISNEISLRDVGTKLGVKKTNTLIFLSNEKLNGNLKREHLAGFSEVKILNLCGNGLTNLPKDLFMDFPELEAIDLSDNNVILPNEIFDPTPNLKRIELYNNEIKTLDISLINKLENLVFLDLMENELTEIPSTIFDNLVLLQTLLLDMNNLNKLPPYIFSQLKDLDIIDISMNNFSYIPSTLFHNNIKLNQLYFHHNGMDLETLPEYLLSNLANLEEVFLNNNGFERLPENLFWGSTSISTIDLNENKLKTLPKMFFKDLSKLIKVEINDNLIESLPDYIFKDMVNLNVLELSGNNMVTITKNLFEGLKSLKVLSMNNNRLKIIEPTAFSPMESLKLVKLSNNQISFNATDVNWNPFYNNTLLQELYLSNNTIKRFIANWPINKDSLRVLDLSYNNITTIVAEEFLTPSFRITINLRYNNISNIWFHVIKRPWKFYTIERDIQILIDNNPILCDCYLYDYLRWSEKKMVNYYYNYFKFLIGDLSCVRYDGTLGPKIKNLRTSTYTCSENDHFGTKEICPDNCTCNVKLSDKTRIMDCSNKGLSNFSIDQSKVNLDNKYANSPLMINLSSNFLTEIPSLKLLSKLNLTTLLLSNNNISQVTIDRIPKTLRVLHLHNNNISKVNFEVITYFKSKSVKELTFSGNPIICDCKARDFYLFVQTMRHDFKDLENVTCKNMSHPMFWMNFDDFECPTVSCDYTGVIRTIFISFSVAVLLTILILIWYFRKDIIALIPNNLINWLVRGYTRLQLNHI